MRVSRFDPQAVRQAHAVTLAENSHLTYTARLVTRGQHRDIYTVPSRDRSSSHLVVRIQGSGEYRCDCRASEYDLPCAHIGAAIWHDFFRFGGHLPTPTREAA